MLAEAALRETAYTISQTPDLRTPTAVFPPSATTRSTGAILKPRWICGRRPWSGISRSPAGTAQLRHVIEPEITYRYVAGIGAQARNVLLIDTTDIATNTNEVGYSLTQRFYLRPTDQQPCAR